MNDAWRSTIREIVDAFVEGDFALSRGITDVEPSTPRLGEQRRFAVASSGQTLAHATDVQASATQGDDVWNVIVSLPTVHSGGLALVVELRVTEREGGFRYTVSLIYVP